MHGGGGDSEVCLLWTPLLLKHVVAADRALHNPMSTPSREKALTEFQFQTRLVMSAETLLCLQGAELGVQQGGS